MQTSHTYIYIYIMTIIMIVNENLLIAVITITTILYYSYDYYFYHYCYSYHYIIFIFKNICIEQWHLPFHGTGIDRDLVVRASAQLRTVLPAYQSQRYMRLLTRVG